MVLDKLFGKEAPKTLEGDEYIELDTSSVQQASKIPIKIEALEDFADTDRIQKIIRNGAIVLIKIKTLKDKDMSELKRAIDKLRKTCIAMNGDIAGIDEDFIICTPAFANIVREN